jgi:hypothetical protein
MIAVLEVLPGDRAIVSTAGLVRVVVPAENDIVAELIDKREAELTASLLKKTWPEKRFDVVAYDALPQSSSS